MALYSKELEEVLNAMDLNAYLEFVKKWYELGLVDKKVYIDLLNADYETQNNAYCRTILMCVGDNINYEAREWAENHVIKKEDINA